MRSTLILFSLLHLFGCGQAVQHGDSALVSLQATYEQIIAIPRAARSAVFTRVGNIAETAGIPAASGFLTVADTTKGQIVQRMVPATIHAVPTSPTGTEAAPRYVVTLVETLSQTTNPKAPAALGLAGPSPASMQKFKNLCQKLSTKPLPQRPGTKPTPASPNVRVYRGIPSTNDAVVAGLFGAAIPSNPNGDYSPDDHVAVASSLGDSQWTSWTTDPGVAIDYALKNCVLGGIVLGLEVPESDLGVPSESNWKQEVLLSGVVNGANVTLIPDIR